MRLEHYLNKSAAQLGEQAAQQEHTFGSTFKGIGKNVLLAGAAMVAPGLASKGFGALKQTGLSKLTEMSNKLPGMASAAMSKPGVSNFMTDVSKAFNNFTSGGQAPAAAEAVKNGKGLLNNAKSQRVVQSRSNRVMKGTSRNSTNSAIRQSVPVVQAPPVNTTSPNVVTPPSQNSFRQPTIRRTPRPVGTVQRMNQTYGNQFASVLLGRPYGT